MGRPPDTGGRTILAAGGVVYRHDDDGGRIAVIHRPHRHDWSLPKGKVDPGETLPETAVREIFEETGIRVALGIPVGVSRYRMPRGRQKIVHYWAAEATDDAIRVPQDITSFVDGKPLAVHLDP